MTFAVSLSLLGSQGLKADTIYGATGYPVLSHTDGNPEMPAYYSQDVGNAWWATGSRVTISTPTLITGIQGVGSTDDANWADFSPALNIFGGAAPEQAFADSPFSGDVFTGSISLSGTPQAFGTGWSGLPDYYAAFSLTPFVLMPGDYVFSITVTRTGGEWAWVESHIDLGSGIFTYDETPGRYFEYESQGWAPFTTGTPAIDIEGIPVPEPASFAFFLTSVCLLRRSRRSTT